MREAGAPSGLADPASGSFFHRFLAGASIAASAIGLTLRSGALLRRALVPMAIQLAIFAGLLGLGLFRASALASSLGPAPGHWYSFLASVLYVALVLAIVGLAAVLALFLGSVVCDPLYDGLSEATEALLLGRPVEPAPSSFGDTIAGIVRELRASLLRLAVYLAGSLVLFLVGLTGVGSVVAGPASLAWTWFFLTAEVIGRPQARHAIGARARLSAAREQVAVALGFGAVASLLAPIPMSTPILVVGGTRLFLALAAHDRVPSKLADADKQRLRAGPISSLPAQPR